MISTFSTAGSAKRPSSTIRSARPHSPTACVGVGLRARAGRAADRHAQRDEGEPARAPRATGAPRSTAPTRTTRPGACCARSRLPPPAAAATAAPGDVEPSGRRRTESVPRAPGPAVGLPHPEPAGWRDGKCRGRPYGGLRRTAVAAGSRRDRRYGPARDRRTRSTAQAERGGARSPTPSRPARASGCATLVGADAWLTTTHLLLGLWVGARCLHPDGRCCWRCRSACCRSSCSASRCSACALWLTRLLARLERGRFRLVLGVDIPDSQPRRLPGGVLQPAPDPDGLGRRLARGGLPAAPAAARRSSSSPSPSRFWSVPIGAAHAADLQLVAAQRRRRARLRHHRPVLVVDRAGRVLGLVLLVLVAAAGALARPRDLAFARRHARTRRGRARGPGRRAGAQPGRGWSTRPRQERRRIERDLHDGAQQRLVALAMNLGRAKARYDQDPEAARALIDEAHARRQAGAGRAARPRPRAAPGGAGRPRPGRRAVRPGRPVTGAGHRRGRPGRGAPAGRPGGRGDRLLRGRRGADQRRQARAGHPGRGGGPPAGRACCGSW